MKSSKRKFAGAFAAVVLASALTLKLESVRRRSKAVQDWLAVKKFTPKARKR